MKNAVVIGASGGLGSAIVDRLIGSGYRVLGTYRNRGLAPRDGLTPCPLDLASPASVEDFVVRVELFGQIDFFTSTVANPARIERFENIDADAFSADLEIGVLRPVELLQRFAPLFTADAHVLFVLSKFVLDEEQNYCASYIVSKYALLGLMRTLAYEFHARGVHVNAVSPGMMDTAFLDGAPSFLRQAYLQKSGHLIEPEDVAECVIELITSNANGINVPV